MLPHCTILDSGAVSLYTRNVQKNTIGGFGRTFKDRRGADGTGEDYTFYETKEFFDYRKAYIKYVRKNDKHLTGYINLDIINNPEASYESLKYMERKGCHPLPVFHLGSDVKWLRRYLKEGYTFICIGGVTPNKFEAVEPVLDKLWKDTLTDSNNFPKVKVHGLACTSFRLIKTYPWWSVDSTSWRKLAAYGKIVVPRLCQGRFDFDTPPLVIGASFISPTKKVKDMHLLSLSKKSKDWIYQWLDKIKVPLGSVNDEEEMIEWGVLSHHNARGVANMKYYCELAKSVPDWPWAFNKKIKKGFFI